MHNQASGAANCWEKSQEARAKQWKMELESLPSQHERSKMEELHQEKLKLEKSRKTREDMSAEHKPWLQDEAFQRLLGPFSPEEYVWQYDPENRSSYGALLDDYSSTSDEE